MTPQPALQALSLDERARDLLRDLHAPKARIFCSDLIVTAFVAWSAFLAALFLDSLAAVCALLIAGLAAYRGVCFIHELTHLRSRALPGFETAWNFLFGVPLLLPSLMYVGVHQDHHRISTYGTPRDPEYMPFARSNIMMLVFVAHSILIPVFLFLRFTISFPVALVFPPLHRWLEVHASALSMNLAYRRHAGCRAGEHNAHWETAILVIWAPLLAAMSARMLPWRVLSAWYFVAATASFINTLRTLGAHHYQSSGEPLDRTQSTA